MSCTYVRTDGERRAENAGVLDASPDQDPDRPLVETRLHTRKGNSDGAVLNEFGQLIGLVHAGNGDMLIRRTDMFGREVDVRRGDHTLVTPVDLVRRTLGGSSKEFKPVDIPSRPGTEVAELPDLADFFRRRRRQPAPETPETGDDAGGRPYRAQRRPSILDIPAVRELIAALLRPDGRGMRFESPYARNQGDRPQIRIIIRISRC